MVKFLQDAYDYVRGHAYEDSAIIQDEAEHAPVYETRLVEVRPDQSWTAELTKDGKAILLIHGHSISALLKRYSSRKDA